MKVLGLNLSHHASAAIIKDGEVSFALENDRLSKKKHDSSIEDLLSFLSNKHFKYVGYTSYNISESKKLFYKNLVQGNLKKNNIGYEELIEFPHHHVTHAFSSFYNSGFDEAICLIIDNGGLSFKGGEVELGQEVLSIIKINHDGYEDVFKICSNQQNFIFKKNNIQSYPAISPASLFEIAQNIFKYKEPGAVMGKSSYGKKDMTIPNIFKFKENGFYINLKFLYDLIIRNKQNENNFCFKIQKESTDLVLKYLELIKKTFPKHKICLSGGFFQNCMTNYEIIKNKYDVFVDPISHDGGTSIGLAQHIYKIKTNEKSKKYDSLYLGPRYPKLSKLFFEEIIAPNKKLIFKKVSKKDVAKLLVENKSIGLFQGKSEFGPRALGNRSILLNPMNPFAKDKINLIKKREWFRPYAGTVLHEDKDDWFYFYNKEETKFMSYAVKIKKEKVNMIPGICHIDETCRVQTLKKKENIHFYELIEEFKNITNVPLLLNTSLNQAGMPLVESPADLADFVLNTDIDYLYLPDFDLLISQTLSEL